MFPSARAMTAKVPLVLELNQYARLQSSTVVPIDVSWHMPAANRAPLKDYYAARLPRARFLDLDEMANHEHPLALPHMLPSPNVFAQTCQKLGITRESHVVFYDSVGVFSAPRALFTFKAFGHERASILNGGLPAWQLAGYPIEEGESSVSAIIPQTDYLVPGDLTSQSMVRTYEEIAENAKSSPFDNDETALVLDARAPGRFNGTSPEPRPGLPSGHIPHSYSVPFNTLLTDHQYPSASFTTLKDSEQLREILGTALLANGRLNDPFARKIVTTCGSGMTAAIIWLALQQIGVESALYDESWMGYAARSSSIIERDE
ncbi:Rhodanese-like protein [Clavulina sp. PMI_390]|nr:Rhodanese-like protein [Clavulina sp. PMI_390]